MELEHSLFSDVARKRLECAQQKLPANLQLFLVRLRRVAEWIRDGNARHDPIRTDGLGDGYDRADVCARNPRSLDFLGQRCTATRTRASGRREDDCVHPVREEARRHLTAETLSLRHLRCVADRRIVAVVQSADSPLAFQSPCTVEW